MKASDVLGFEAFDLAATCSNPPQTAACSIPLRTSAT
jgi:hypothetical protein